jgi:hypothetical protein
MQKLINRLTFWTPGPEVMTEKYEYVIVLLTFYWILLRSNISSLFAVQYRYLILIIVSVISWYCQWWLQDRCTCRCTWPWAATSRVWFWHEKQTKNKQKIQRHSSRKVTTQFMN